MTDILKYLWKQAFGDAGFSKDKMNQAAEDSYYIKNRHIANFVKIRRYGNGATHETAWDAGMSGIIEIKDKHEPLVDALLAEKSAKASTLLQKYFGGNGGSDRD